MDTDKNAVMFLDNPEKNLKPTVYNILSTSELFRIAHSDNYTTIN